jgi:hypothetical protein
MGAREASEPIRRPSLPAFGPTGAHDAAQVLSLTGAVMAVIAEPLAPPNADDFRAAVVETVGMTDWGDTIMAGVAFTDRWGGDAISFT